MPVEYEDFMRLLTELMEKDPNGVDTRAWAENHNIDPEALVQLVSTLTWNVNEHYMNEIIEGPPDGMTEDGGMVYTGKIDMAVMLGTVAFQAFCLAWEAAIQFAHAASEETRG